MLNICKQTIAATEYNVEWYAIEQSFVFEFRKEGKQQQRSDSRDGGVAI
jgi:hypothetical protein